MGMVELTEAYVGQVLDRMFGDDVEQTDHGHWNVPGQAMGRVRVVGDGPSDAWVEVCHVVALDVHNWSPRLWEVANRASCNSSASVVLMGEVLVTRMVLHANEVSPTALNRAINLTFNLSASLCDVVVGELAIGTCPDVVSPEYDAPFDGGGEALTLDLGMAGHDAGTSVTSLVAASSALTIGSVAGYL